VLQDSKVKSVVSSQVVPLSVMRPPKLVGRQNSIEQAQASFATLIVLMGEAGIGKTRLMAELAPEAVLIKAEESLSNVPFHAIAEFIKKQTEHPLEALGVYVNDLVRLIPDVAPHIKAGPAEVFTAKQRLLEALVRYFEAIAVAKDFAIAFDDIQWLDENSLEFLALLHNRGNLKLIATCRKYEAPKHLTELINTLASTEVINIEALSFEDIQSLLAELMDKDVQPTLFAKWLHNNTSGNIMFVLETLKSLFESGDLRADEDGWHSNLDEVTKDYSELVLPKLVADLIQRRIEPLSEEVKRVLQGAAVISNNINEKILSQITGLSQWSVLEAVELGQTVGVLTGTSFKHDLLRQSIYSNLSKSKRSFLHARVAETLDSRNTDKSSKDNLLIAQHWLDAYEEEKAARAILEAVRQQFHIGLHSEAIKNLEHYVDLELEQSLKHEIQYLLCILFMDSGQLDKSTDLLTTLSQQSKDPIMQAQVMCSQLKIGINQGRTQEVEDIFSELQKLETSHELPIGVKRDILANKAVIAHYKGEYDNSIKLQLESNELCRQLGDKLSLALGLSSLGAVYDYAGRYDDALSSYNESLKISQSLNALHLQQEVALNIVSCYADMGRHDEAIDVGLTALKLGRYDATDFLRNNLAAAYFEVNQNDEAIQQFESLIAETENNTLKCNAWARLIKLYGDQMQFDKQKTALKQSLILVRETSSPTPVSRVIISCLEHGSDEDKIAARALLKGLDINSVPPVARAELQQVLKDHT